MLTRDNIPRMVWVPIVIVNMTLSRIWDGTAGIGALKSRPNMHLFALLAIPQTMLYSPAFSSISNGKILARNGTVTA